MKINADFLSLTASVTLGFFLFSTFAPPFAQASMWEERKVHLQERQNPKKENLIAQLPALSLNVLNQSIPNLGQFSANGFAVEAGSRKPLPRLAGSAPQ